MGGIRLRPGRPLLAGSARRWAGVLLACCAVLVAVLGLLFAGQATADPFDRIVDSQLIAWLGGHRQLLLWLAALGTLVPAAALSAAIIAGCLFAGRLNGAVLAAAAVPAAVEVDERLLKPLVHRTYSGDTVYPSGHTTAMFALAATLAVLLLGSPRTAKPAAARLVIPAAAMVACAVAAAVIGLRWHYFTDTVAGAAVGTGTVCGLALMLDLPAVRRCFPGARQRSGDPPARLSAPSQADGLLGPGGHR